MKKAMAMFLTNLIIAGLFCGCQTNSGPGTTDSTSSQVGNTGTTSSTSSGTTAEPSSWIQAVTVVDVAGDIKIDSEKHTVVIPVYGNKDYTGVVPEWTLADGVTLAVQETDSSDLNGSMCVLLTKGNETQRWTVQTEETYDESEKASLLNFNPVYGDNMVLQRDKQIVITGGARGVSRVKVEFAGYQRRVKVENETWTATFPAMSANAQGQTILVTAAGKTLEAENVVIGDVYLCSGQSNMAFSVGSVRDEYKQSFYDAAENSNIRYSLVDYQDSDQPLDQIGNYLSWKPATMQSFQSCSAIAYAFAATLQPALDIPVGIVVSAMPGTCIEQWLSNETLAEQNINLKDITTENYQQNRFNAMISPLGLLAIKGVIWYQGEDSCDRPTDYTELFGCMLNDWREVFDDEQLPFLVLQLPSYWYDPWAPFREIQWNLMTTYDYVYTVCGIDLGEANDVHCHNKFPFGQRTANMALQFIYGQDILAISPYPKEITRNGGTITVKFDNVGDGLKVVGNGLRADVRVWTADGDALGVTTTLIAPDTIEITGDAVADAVAVSYAYWGNPRNSLYTESDLPVAPFYHSFE